MGKAWDSALPTVEVWQELLSVCKPGAMLLSFGGTRTFHRLACAIEDAGWEMRDCINWLYGSGFPKSLDISKAIDKAAGAERELTGRVKPGHEGFANRGNMSSVASFKGTLGGTGGFERPWMDDPEKVEAYHQETAPSTDAAKEWNGWGTALKPAWEPIIVAMKALDGTFAQNALKHGVAGLAVDRSRVPLNGDYKCGANGRPSQTGLGDNYEPDSANQHSEVGRFPANVIHDGSDEVLAGFPQTTSGAIKPHHIRTTSKTKNAYGDRDAPPEQTEGSTGSAARFFYCAKASSSERGSRPSKEQPLFGDSDPGFTNTHPTVKPLALMKYLLQLVSTPTGGIVLDPFMGSGSTLVAAKALGRRAIGIEINKEYCDIAIQRLAGT